MEYDVTGNLKIDTEPFEKALKDAQTKLNKFKEDFQSLNNMSAGNSFKELSESLNNVEQSVQDLKLDFDKVDKSADNVTKSVENLNKETKKVKETVTTLDDYFDNVSKSARKVVTNVKSMPLTDVLKEATETLERLKKNIRTLGESGAGESAIRNATKEYEKQKKIVEELTQRINSSKSSIEQEADAVKKTGASFSEMDKTVSSSMTNINNRMEELETRLKKSRASLKQYYEEFNNLNTRWVRNAERMERFYSVEYPRHWHPRERYKQNLREPQVGVSKWALDRLDENIFFNRYGNRTAPRYGNQWYENKSIKEEWLYTKRTLEEELKLIGELEREMAELEQQKKSLMSSSTDADKLVYELEAPIMKIRELRREMDKLYNKNISEHSGFHKTFKEGALGNTFLIDEKQMDKMKARFKEIFEELNVARDKIKGILDKLVNDYGLSMDEISSLTGGLFDPKILTEGLSEAVLGINPTLDELKRKISKTRKELQKIQEDAMNVSKRLTRDAIESNKGWSRNYLPRRKDGSYYNNSRVNRVLDEFRVDQNYAETYQLDKFLKLKAELESLEREFEELSKEKNKFLNEDSYTTSGLKSQIEMVNAELKRTKQNLRSSVRDVRYPRRSASNLKEGSYLYNDYMNQSERAMKTVIALRDKHRELGKELERLKSLYNMVWRVEELEPFIQMMTQVATSTDNATESVEKLGAETTKVSENAGKVETAFTKGLNNIKVQIKEVQQAGQGIYKFFRSNANLNTMGKWFAPQVNTPSTNRWIHEQLSTTRDFFKGFTQGFAKLKKEQSESVTWMNEFHTKMNELRYGSRDFINTEVFAKAKAEADKYMVSLDKMRRKLGLIEKYQYQRTGNAEGVGFAGSSQFQEAIKGAERYTQELKRTEAQIRKTAEAQRLLTLKYKPQFSQYGAGFLGDANIQKDIQLVNEFNRVTREVSASTNQWVNESITGFNKFSQAVQKSSAEAENRITKLNATFKSMGASLQSFKNDVAIGKLFSGSDLTNKVRDVTGKGLNEGLKEYNRLTNIANLNTERMGLGFQKFGQYSKQAESSVRSLSGVFRTLRTTMSMIGGMFVWEFAFKIMDATKVTISAKSEMESYYKTLGMGSREIASFNNMLDQTVNKFQKMNKFQLGETISALGVEFKMNTDEMNQIMKVAPMIVNEYLRAGRSTEEAILAIKDISQGEFLRLSRETGVGKEEIEDAGWNGDNKDILSLYKALEKIGKARHWDVFASKATSLNDVLLITENRMTEFATLLSDSVTPIIVGSFNALGDAFNGASRWYESLDPSSKVWTQITVLGTAGLTTAGIFNSHLVPALKNFGTNIISSFLGVDSAIVKEKGLAQAIAHETAVERIANIERKGGQKVLNAKIMTLKAEELANKLGMSTTKLRARYENLQAVAISKGKDSLKAKELAQRSLILAEEQNITTTQAMNILLEEEALAEMGTVKALMVRKLGLDATLVSEEGMAVALNERIAQSVPYIGSLVAETLATIGLESATATLLLTLGLLIAPLVAIGFAVAPLIQQFAELQASYEKVNDVLTSGQERIDSLKESKEKLTKTEEKLANKTDRTTQESQKLDSVRKQLTDTDYALKLAEEELAEAQKFDESRIAYTTQLEASRYKNVQDINKELQKSTGTNDEIISQTITMDKAFADMTKNMQIANYMENKRPERFEQFNQKLKEGSKSQEEYNQKVKEFGNDWNQAYNDMEDAQTKLANPELSGFDRLWARWDGFWAEAKMKWIEFWADPWASIGGYGEWALLEYFNISIDQCKQDWEDFTNWFNDGLSDLVQSWDDFWQPLTDFFNSLSVGTDFDPFAGIKEWWGDTNDWLSSLLPDISVDSIKEWFGKNVREPFQKEFREFMKNPLGNSKDEEKAQGGTATKSISLGNIFNFDFNGLRAKISKGWSGALGGVPTILKGAGDLWSRLSNNNGLKVVSSSSQGLSGLKQAVTQKLNEGKNAISNSASGWGRSAHSLGSSIYSHLRDGVGDLRSLISSKFKGIKEAIDNAKKGISASVKAVAEAITSPLSGLHLPTIGFGGGFYGSRRSTGGRIRMPHIRGQYYGSSPNNMGFETVLRTMLTEQGFRSPSSYQFYPNSMKTTQEAWDSGKANCFDGARVILALASMFGLKGHMVTGTWNGTGHSGAMIGGKLYDMTQFQRRGVFRGTSGVHFGSSAQRTYGVGKQETNKTVNINITNDLSNARIYGIDDLDNHIKQTTEKTFYELNSVDGAIGY